LAEGKIQARQVYACMYICIYAASAPGLSFVLSFWLLGVKMNIIDGGNSFHFTTIALLREAFFRPNNGIDILCSQNFLKGKTTYVEMNQPNANVLVVNEKMVSNAVKREREKEVNR
jgi:hypothetical protein